MGFVAAASCGALALVVSPSARRRTPIPIAGLAVAAAALLVLDARRSVSLGLVVAIAGIAIVCAIPRGRLPPAIAAAIAVPFALLLAADVDRSPTWTRVLVVGVASAGAIAAARTDELWRQPAVTPLLLTITAGAIYVAVPDTEEAAVVLGVALPVALLGWPVRLVSLGRAGAGAAIALVAWTAATGGRADPASVVGGLASVALLVGLSVGALLTRLRDDPAPRLGRVPVTVWALSSQAALALLASRAGAAGAGTARAAVVATIVVIASVLAGMTLRPPH
jgi:hypothetical protein